MSGPAFSTSGTINVGSNPVTIPAITSGQIIVVSCSTPTNLGVGNITVSGAGATWNVVAEGSGAPIDLFYVGTSPTVGSTSITIAAASGNVGVGSYVVMVWNLITPPTTPFNYVVATNNPTNGVPVTTPSINYGSGEVVLAVSAAYDSFAGGTPPIWSNGLADNQVAYAVQGSGTRPLWVSWIQDSSSGSTTYTSPFSDALSTGVAVVLLVLGPASTSQLVLIL